MGYLVEMLKQAAIKMPSLGKGLDAAKKEGIGLPGKRNKFGLVSKKQLGTASVQPAGIGVPKQPGVAIAGANAGIGSANPLKPKPFRLQV
jgi:hypothetical protein